MKIDKNKPAHWLYLIWTGCLILLLIPLRLIKKNKSPKSIILYGHKLHGNLYALYTLFEENEDLNNKYECSFLTIDPEYYQDIKRKKRILFALNPLHLIKLVLSDCIVSDHGLHSLLLVLKFTNINFVDVWHGIPFKGFIPDDFKIQHKYNEIWVSSSLLQSLYIDRFGFNKAQVHVTGYGRTDLLLRYHAGKEVHKDHLRIPKEKKVILFAPTWKQDSTKRNEIPFGLTPEEFISKLEHFVTKNDAFLIVRFHLNTLQNLNLKSSNILYLPLSTFPDSEMVIALSDMLITDWSSITFDFMAINNPIVFLDVPSPFKNGFSLPHEFRVGDLTKSIEELVSSLAEICHNEKRYIAKYQKEYQKIKSLVYDDTLDGNSTERYLSRLKNLLKNKKIL